MLYPLLCQIQPIALKGLSFLGVVEGSAIYTHWLLDTLPRLLALMDHGWRLDQFDNLVIADHSKPFQQAVLDQLGVRPEQVISRRARGRLFRVEGFVHVSAPRTRFVAHPRAYQMVDAFIGGPRTRRPERRILVSRSDARRRKIVNEDALRAELEPRGFETVRFEDLSIAQTATLISEASHIVAPHGAGLANLIFANPGTRVLELFSGHLSREYWTICAQQGLDYWNLRCDGPDGPVSDEALKKMDYFARNGLDIAVPVRQAVDFIDNIFLA
ncbi:glycosyltransferase family 61 protein [Paracoccus jiaweipingae]|uniref:glycosyltransferase family 61 protein n=1 Tax=unclassified Paracoccus (in: a-proteobacteria) TaxID=2688777 RepID=UPI00379C9CDE